MIRHVPRPAAACYVKSVLLPGAGGTCVARPSDRPSKRTSRFMECLQRGPGTIQGSMQATGVSLGCADTERSAPFRHPSRPWPGFRVRYTCPERRLHTGTRLAFNRGSSDARRRGGRDPAHEGLD